MDGTGLRKYLCILVVSLTVAACSTQTVEDAGAPANGGDQAAGEAGSSEFNAFDQQAAAAPEQPAANAGGGDEFSNFNGSGDESAVENEIQAGNAGAPPAAGGDEFSQFDNQAAAPPAEAAPNTPPAIDPGGEPQTQELPSASNELPPAEAPQAEAAPAPEAPAPEAPAPEAPAPQVAEASETPVHLKSLQFRANDNGGTVVIEADGPMQFTTRTNPDNQQFVVEIPNSILPKKLKRSLNTKDFGGAIGAVDAYQNKGSNLTRVVLQLRPGEQEPTVQAEGNSLLVVTNPSGPAINLAQKSPTEVPPPAVAENAAPPPSPAEPEPPSSKLMTSDNLEEFIASNQHFYGKKISIETDEVEVREVFKLISDEANVNLILADDVKGKVSVKLKNVPWDQALVLVMKTKKLGYTRSGNVIRIANLTDIRSEEKEALDLQNQRRQNAVPKVRTIQVNYAKVDELEKQIKGVLTKNGSAVADLRTSSLIVTDLEENIERAVKVVQSLDVPPQQVLIEGKIIEAKNDSEQNLGINWSSHGSAYQLGNGASGPVSGNTDVSVTPDIPLSRTFNIDMRMGTFDILGDLSATLALFEKESKVKILSSPRIVAMHNEKASIEQTLEVPIKSSTVSNGAVNNNITFKEVKLLLDVTPQITNDGAVLMGVKLERDFLGDVVDPVSGARENNRRAANTRILVRNGQTAVIGGIYQSDTSQGESRVPYLGKIPVLGWLFRGEDFKETKNELLIFLTPRILGQLDSQIIPSQNINNNSTPPPAAEPGLEF